MHTNLQESNSNPEYITQCVRVQAKSWHWLQKPLDSANKCKDILTRTVYASDPICAHNELNSCTCTCKYKGAREKTPRTER